VATTVTIPTPTIHWLLYPLLVAGLLGTLWLWHDTRLKGATAQVVATAQTIQTKTDAVVTAQDKEVTANLQKQNADLSDQLLAAKNVAQQVALINKQASTHLVEIQSPLSSPQDKNPSLHVVEGGVWATGNAPVLEGSAADADALAKQVTSLAQCENQTAADKLELSGKDLQIGARDETIKAQEQEVVALKGGSHWKRFFTATKHILIGAAAGAAIGYALHR